MKTLLSIITLTSIIIITICYADDAVVTWKTSPADIIIEGYGQVKTCVFEVTVKNEDGDLITPDSLGVNLYDKRFSYTSGADTFGLGWAKKTYSNVTCTDYTSFINKARARMWAQQGSDAQGYTPEDEGYYYEEYTF